MEIASEILDFIFEILNSSLFIAFVGGLVGALGGALGAQHIIEKATRKSDLVRELRNTNAATMVSFSIVNTAFALKRQHVQPMFEEFQKDKADLIKFRAEKAAGKIPPDSQFPFLGNLRSFPAPVVPMETLKMLVFEKISAQGRALALVSVVEQSLEGLRGTISRRETLCQQFQSGEIPIQVIPHHYFGLPLSSGTNQEYPDLIECIHEYLNDLAFFAALLCEDLHSHAEGLHKKFPKRLRGEIPKAARADFSGPRAAGLFPSEKSYSSWLEAFATDNREGPVR